MVRALLLLAVVLVACARDALADGLRASVEQAMQSEALRTPCFDVAWTMARNKAGKRSCCSMARNRYASLVACESSFVSKMASVKANDSDGWSTSRRPTLVGTSIGMRGQHVFVT